MSEFFGPVPLVNQSLRASHEALLNGIELQTYAAIIVCMLIALWTDHKPTLRTYEMLCWYFTDMADEDELISHIQRLQKLA